jgi:hypothetical protein
MRKVALLILLASALTLSAAAQASPPEAVAGTFVAPPPAPTSLRTAGENCIAEIPDTFQLAGPLSGALALHFEIVFHGPCSAFPAFPANFRAQGTFEGTVDVAGMVRVGTFAFAFNGTIDSQGLAHGRLVVERGSGGLSGLHGVLELAGIPGIGGSYAGSVHLDP